MKAVTSSVLGEVNREEGQCQGPNSFLWPLSSGAVVKPQGRQLYQHILGLRVVSFTQTPLNSHQSRLCTSSKHREKQQTLNNYRPRGAVFWGCSELAGKNVLYAGSTELHMCRLWCILASGPIQSNVINREYLLINRI